MKKSKQTTRKRARDSRRTSGGRWRMVYVGPRNGKRQVLKAPDGRIFEGTRGEVAEAALTPYERAQLSNSLRILRGVLKGDGELLREEASRARRDRLREHFAFTLNMPGEALEIMVGASARYMERSVAAFKGEALAALVEASIDEAMHDGLEELPLTRHEKAALAAFGKSQADFNALLQYKRAVAAS